MLLALTMMLSPILFVDGGYVVVDAALNGETNMMNARLPFCAGAYVMRLATFIARCQMAVSLVCKRVNDYKPLLFKVDALD
jgi:hypothetical protein